jgi:hypothetical protein
VDAFSYIKEKVFVKLGVSYVHGVGVFALRDIEPNTNLFEPWTGDTGRYNIQERDLDTLPKPLYTHIKDIFLYNPDFPKDTSTFITLVKGCHWIYTTPYYYINSGGEKSNVDKDTFKSTKFIREGEELLSNYGRYERLKRKLL